MNEAENDSTDLKALHDLAFIRAAEEVLSALANKIPSEVDNARTPSDS